MNLRLIVSDEDFDKEVGNLIKERAKAILRSDKEVSNLIQEIAKEEVKKRINAYFMDHDIKKVLIQLLQPRLPSPMIITNVLLKEMRATLVEMGFHKEPIDKEEHNTKAIQELFVEELKQQKEE